MTRLERNRHFVLLVLWAVCQIILALAMGFSHRDWLPWLEQGPLGIWLNSSVLLSSSSMMGLAVIAGRRDGSWRGLALSCLAALLVGTQWALGQIGAAILASHWIPAPAAASRALIPVLGGVVCCAPLVVMPIISSVRQKRRISNSRSLKRDPATVRPDGA